jgi:hypothetical protein
MIRRNLMIGAAALLLASPAQAYEIGANDRLTSALLQQIQARPAPAQAAPAPQGNIFSNITLGQVLGTMTGAVAGKVLLESALDLPQGVGVVAGAVAGYYIWITYFQNMEGPSALRKASATGSDTKMFLIADTLIDVTSPLLRPAALTGR